MIKKLISLILLIIAVSCLTVSHLAFGEELQSISMLFNPSEFTLTPLSENDNYPNEKGLEISSEQGKTLEFKGKTCGDFEFVYIPEISSGKYSVESLELNIASDDSDELFRIIVEHTNIKYDVSVDIGGERSGIYYGFGYGANKKREIVNGKTATANLYNNYSETNAGEKIYIKFSPDDMCVYAGEDRENYRLVWNLSSCVNDLKHVNNTLNKFNFYNVSLSFAKCEGVGKIIAYSFDSMALDSSIFSDQPIYQIYSSVIKNGLVNETYEIPQGYVYEVGKSIFSCGNRVYYIDNNNRTLVCENSNFFKPEIAGNYIIEYYTETGNGEITKRYVIEVSENMPEVNFIYDKDISDTYYDGEKVYFPECYAIGGLNLNYKQPVKLTIFKNGIARRAYENIDGGFFYEVKGSDSIYSVVYSYGNYSEKFDFVVNETPVFTADLGFSTKDIKNGDVLDFNDSVCYFKGEKVNTDLSVTFPDGSIYSNKIISAKDKGKYQIKFTYKMDGNVYETIKEINVEQNPKNLFLVSDSNTKVNYGYSNSTFEKGVNVKASVKNSKVIYSKEIDISAYVNQTKKYTNNKGNSVTVIADNAVPLIDFTIDPFSFGVSAVDYVIVTLTDTYDATNKISVIVNCYNNDSWSYIKAKAGTQGYMGCNSVTGKNSESVLLDNTNVVKRTAMYGFMSYGSFVGKISQEGVSSDNRITIFYDNDEKQILSYPGSPAVSESCIINDFDDRNYCNGDIWKGFTGENAILSLEFGNISHGSCSATIYSAGGVDFGSHKTNKTYCLLSQGKSFATVSMTDNSGDYSVLLLDTVEDYEKNLKVFYDGATRKKKTILNGNFIADKSGEYVIEYPSYDRNGKVVTKTKTFNIFYYYANVLNKDTGKYEYKATFSAYVMDTENITSEQVMIDSPEFIIDDIAGEGLKGEYYFAPSAFAYDNVGENLDIILKVYYKHNGILYDVNVRNNSFLTDKAGEYVLRYYAVNKYKSYFFADKTINVLENKGDIDFSLSPVIIDGKVGVPVDILKTEEIEVTDSLCGYNVSVNVYASDGREIDIINNTFIGDREGEYTVKYTVIDGIGREKTDSYIVNIIKNNGVAVKNDLPLYYGFVRGNSYVLSDVTLIDYAENGKEVKADIYINGVKTNGEYTPEDIIEGVDVPENTENVEIKYSYKDWKKIYNVPLKTRYKKYVRTNAIGKTYEVTNLKMERYFTTDSGMTVNAIDTNLNLQIKGEENINSKAYFLNKLASESFSFKFDVNKKDKSYSPVNTNIKSVKIIITDVINPSIKLEIKAVTYLVDGVYKSYYEYGSESTSAVNGSLYGTASGAFLLSYKNQERILTDENGILLGRIEKDYYGNDFNGFSDFVYFSVEIERYDNLKPATIQMQSLNGQALSDTSKDSNGPVIFTNSQGFGTYELNSKIIIPCATARDVLNDVDNNSMTVKVVRVDGNGNETVLTSTDGIKLDGVSSLREYEILLDKVGNYRIKYCAKDSARDMDKNIITGNSSEKSYDISVIVRQKPIITLEKKISESGKVGEEIILPEANVTYFEQSNENLLRVVLISPTNKYVLLSDLVFTPDMKGKYKVRYFALDTFGNCSINEYVIIVTK